MRRTHLLDRSSLLFAGYCELGHVHLFGFLLAVDDDLLALTTHHKIPRIHNAAVNVGFDLPAQHIGGAHGHFAEHLILASMNVPPRFLLFFFLRKTYSLMSYLGMPEAG